MPLIVLSALIISACGDRVPRLEPELARDNQLRDIDSRMSETRRNEIRDNLLNSISNRTFTEPDPALYRDREGTRFVKISSLGLPIRPTSDTEWSCVYDFDSKLVWEVKDERYRRFWNAQYPNTTNLLPGQAPTAVRGKCEYDAGISQTDLIEGDSCHTEGYVAFINEGKGLCGFNDWRMPTAAEMLTFLDPGTSSPFYNTEYFPHPQMLNMWTSDSAGNEAVYYPLLANTLTLVAPRANLLSVRLVRGPVAAP